MKKTLIILTAFVIIGLACIWIILPGKQQLNGSLALGAALPLVLRQLPDTAHWQKWWPWPSLPGRQQPDESTVVLKGVSDTQLLLMWYEGTDSIPVEVHMTSKGNDTSLIIWSTTLEAGTNPIKRVQTFASSQRLKNDIQTLLTAFGVYASNPFHAYGFSPEYTEVKDTMLISTKAHFSTHPNTNEIYGLFDRLEKYAVSKGATVSGLPMYNIVAAASGYDIMGALPIDRLIADAGLFKIKRMVDGHLLVTEVKAGPAQVQKLFVQFEQYKADHQLVSPAIPYLQPVTNRLQQPDTTQWITRMCYPIF